MLSPKTAKMLLFVSIQNPLWSKLIRGKVNENKIAGYCDVTRQTIANWKRGGPIGVRPHREDGKRRAGGPIDALVFETVKNVIDGEPYHQALKLDSLARAEALATLSSFVEVYRSGGKNNFYDAARALGLSVTQAQIIRDHAIYDRRPIFERLYYEKTEEDQNRLAEDLRVYEGLYYLWVRRVRGDKRIWLRAPFRVRYDLKIRDGYVIRCKLNAPILKQQSSPYWEYDGFLIADEPSSFWMFERRTRRRSVDFFHLITCAGHMYRSLDANSDALTLSGTYLTTNQDDPGQPVADEAILQKLALDPSKDEDEMVKVMHSHAGCVDKEEECLVLDEFLANFRAAKGTLAARPKF